MKILLYCLCMLALLGEVRAQSQIKEFKFDSLVRAAGHYTKQDETKLQQLNLLALGYPGVNPNKGIETGEQAIVLAQKLNNPLLLAEAYNNKGLNYVAISEYPVATELFEKALAINQSKKNTFGCAHNTANIGDLFVKTGEYKKAKEYAEQALTLFENLPDKAGIAKCYNIIGNVYYSFSEYKNALDFYQKALAINEQFKIKSGMADNLNGFGLVYRSFSEFHTSLEYFQKALAINEQLGNKALMSKNMGNIGAVYTNLSDYNKALEYHQKTLAISEQLGLKNNMAFTLNAIGNVYGSLSNYPMALEYYRKALAIHEQIGGKNGMAMTLGNMGIIYTNLKDYPKALECSQKAVDIYAKIGNKRAEAINLNNIGTVYLDLADYPKAMEYFQKASAMDEQLGYKGGMAFKYCNIAKVYRLAPDSDLVKMGINPTQRYDDALKYTNKGLQIAQETGEVSLQKNCWKELSWTYEAQGDFAKAKDAYTNYIKLRDSIESEEIKQKIERKSMQYEFDKKEAEFKFQQQLSAEQLLRSSQETTVSRQQLLLSNKEKDLQHLAYLKEKAEKQQNENELTLSQKEGELQQAALQSLKKEKDLQQTALQLSQAEVESKSLQRNAFIVGMFLFLALSFFIYRNFVAQRKSNKMIEAGNRELKETQSQLVQQEKLASLGALTAGIAHEIKNPLNFVNNFAELSTELIDELNTATTPQEKKELLQMVKQNLAKIHEHGTRADGIVKSMLAHSRTGTAEKQITDINKLCEEFLNLAYHGMRANIKDFNCTIQKHLDPHLPSLNVVQQDIGRVVLNLINNAFYAIQDKPDATLTLTTKTQPHAVFISIKDNGTGIPEKIKQKIFEPFFTTKPSGAGTGLGLSLSFDIIKAHGGKIEVQSEEGKGTEFMITMPI